MKDYLLRAIAYGNARAAHILAEYYKDQEDFGNMMKYMLWAIEHGSSNAMCGLAIYYDDHGDHNNAVKYWLMAIERGEYHSMSNLANHYYRINHDDVMKYWSMAINHEKRYWLIAIDSGHYNHIIPIIKYCKVHNLMDELVSMFNKILNMDFNNIIVETLVQCSLTNDMLNILVNVDQTKCNPHHTFDLLP